MHGKSLNVNHTSTSSRPSSPTPPDVAYNHHHHLFRGSLQSPHHSLHTCEPRQHYAYSPSKASPEQFSPTSAPTSYKAHNFASEDLVRVRIVYRIPHHRLLPMGRFLSLLHHCVRCVLGGREGEISYGWYEAQRGYRKAEHGRWERHER